MEQNSTHFSNVTDKEWKYAFLPTRLHYCPYTKGIYG
jgi:hypothetical protein